MGKTKYLDIEPDSNFDWSVYEGNYDQDTYEAYKNYFDGKSIKSKDQLKGTEYKATDIYVANALKKEIILDTDNGMTCCIDGNKESKFFHSIGCKNFQEFYDLILNPEKKAEFLASGVIAKAENNRISLWAGIRAKIEAELADQLINGVTKGYCAHILEVNNGGYTVDIMGVDCFLPGSLASAGPIADFESLVGADIMVCVVNYSAATKNFVVSYKEYLKRTLPIRVATELNVGDRVIVKVTGASKNGLFCAIKDRVGEFIFPCLMHRSTMSTEAEMNFEANYYVNGDIFPAYITKIIWENGNKYRVVISDIEPTSIGKISEEE